MPKSQEERLKRAEELMSQAEELIEELLQEAGVEGDWGTMRYNMGFSDLGGLFDDLRERLTKK